MNEIIRENISNPEELEKLFRKDKAAFEKEFRHIYPEIKNYEAAKFWKERLDFDVSKTSSVFALGDLAVLILVCAITGFLIKLPAIFNFDIENLYFYQKNTGLIFLMGISLYTIIVNRPISFRSIIFASLAFIVPAIFMNILPAVGDSSSINLAYIHMPILMWFVYGVIYMNFEPNDNIKRIDFIRHNGDLAILCAIILLAGIALAGVSIGLFSVIDIKIEKFYMEYIAIIGLVSAPIVAAFIIRHYPNITNKIAPIIANIFSPLVLLTLVIYLMAIPGSGKNPYLDRDFLLIFNIMLLGVMAIIFFSISERSEVNSGRLGKVILLLLTGVTLITDIIAISAILYRLGEFGLTPNRVAVLGSNFLILVNLIFIMIDLVKINFNKSEEEKVKITIAKFLPFYLIWIGFVVFALPFIFRLK
jgi:hypothetical protein